MGNTKNEPPLHAERWIYGIAQVLLVTALAGTAYFLTFLHVTAGLMEHRLVFENVDRLFWGMSREYAQRREDLALFPPPQNPAELASWADSIEQHLGFPAVVFLWKDTSFQIVSAPPHLTAFAADLPRIASPATPKGHRFKADTLGNMLLWHGTVTADTTHLGARAFQRIGDPVAWGIISSFEDGRREMADEVLKYDPHNMLISRRWVQGLTNHPDPLSFRVFSGDSLIAAAPKLDTTHSKYADRGGTLRFEYYLADMPQMHVDFLKHPKLLYFLLFVEAAMIVILYLFHRWIKRLTKITGTQERAG